MAKYTFIAYVLWLVGGWFGLHHLYLRRDRQAFIWWCTFGGFFGVGWLRDLFRIPEYVDDANDDPEYMERLTLKMRQRKSPTFSVSRFCGQIAFGWLFGILARTALPEDYLERGSPYRIVLYLVPYATALGVHTVTSIGREAGSLKISTLGAYIGLLIYGTDATGVNSYAFISTLATNWFGKSWRRTPRKKRNICIRLMILGLCAGVYMSLWGSALYFNASVTTSDGETVKLRDAIQHFFKSPAWARTKQTLADLWSELRAHGFEKMWKEFVKAVDPEGEANAYEVLGVPSGSSEKEISASYRKLVREWHPDKHRDPQKKREAELKFMEIQQAYERLSKIQKRRGQRNERQRDREEGTRGF